MPGGLFLLCWLREADGYLCLPNFFFRVDWWEGRRLWSVTYWEKQRAQKYLFHMGSSASSGLKARRNESCAIVSSLGSPFRMPDSFSHAWDFNSHSLFNLMAH